MGSFLKNVVLGRSSISVTELCFGTLTMSRLQADLDPRETIPVFRKALDLGINFFDTAHRYTTYDHVRLGLGKDIRNVVLASKTDAAEITEAREQIDLCFRSLGRDMIDIYLLHNVESEEELTLRRPVLDYLLKLREQGRIRAVGISTHKIAGNLAAARHADQLDILFPIINCKGIGITDGTLDDAIQSIARAHGTGIGIYAMKPLGGGHLRRQAKEAIDWLRNNPAIDAIAIGMKSADEVEVNATLFADGKLPIDIDKIKKIADVDRKTFVNFMCKRCGACAEHCDQAAITMGEKKAEIDPSKCILCGYCARHCPQFAIRVI